MENYWRRRTSRRRFRGGAAATAASLSVIVGIGCGDDDEPRNGDRGTPDGTSRKGGTLNDRLTSDPPGFDLRQFITYGTTLSQAPVYDGLLRYNPADPNYAEESIEGVLATSWEQVDDETLVFQLKPNVKFHNGTALTSDDVKVNYEWIKTPPEGKSTFIGAPFRAVDSIEAPDDSTVRINFAHPSGSFLRVTPAYPYAIHEGALLRSQGEIQQPGIGTGPFKFKAYERSNFLELEKNPEYHIASLPHLDRIRFLIQTDQNSAKASFIGGQTHLYIAAGRPPSDLDDIKSQLGDSVDAWVTAPGANRALLAPSPRDTPLNDPRVRQALHMAIIKQEFNELLADGRSRPGGYLRPGGEWAIPESELMKYPGHAPLDVGEAKQLLTAADASDLSLTLLTSPFAQPIAELTQDQLRKIDVNITLDPVDLNTHRARLASGDFELSATQNAPLLDDPDQTFNDFALEGGSANYSGISSPRIQELFDRQKVILDAAERKDVVQDLERAAIELYTGEV